MGTMHSPKLKGETKDKRSESMQNKSLKNRNTGSVIIKENIRSDSEARRKYIVREEQEKKQSS